MSLCHSMNQWWLNSARASPPTRSPSSRRRNAFRPNAEFYAVECCLCACVLVCLCVLEQMSSFPIEMFRRVYGIFWCTLARGLTWRALDCARVCVRFERRRYLHFTLCWLTANIESDRQLVVQQRQRPHQTAAAARNARVNMCSSQATIFFFFECPGAFFRAALTFRLPWSLPMCR